MLNLSLALAIMLPYLAQAGASGVTFTQEEIASNLANSELIAQTGATCLQSTWSEHLAFYRKNGYSKFYGSRRADYATVEGRKAALLRILPNLARRMQRGEAGAIAELNRREAELETTSCIGLALRCTGQGFAAAGMSSTWSRIYTWLGRPGADGKPLFEGTDLQQALVDLGWKSLYWNPDVTQNAAWDLLDHELNPLQPGKEWMPVWGGHAERWASVLRNHNYYNVPVKDIRTLVNFGFEPSAEFQRAPFFVGTAHAGYHVFPGFAGKVIEGHSTRELSSVDNIQVGPFNPLNQPENGVSNGDGAPQWTRSEHYRSGVIVVPPGFIADQPFTVPPAPGLQPGPVPPRPPSPPHPGRGDLCHAFYQGTFTKHGDLATLSIQGNTFLLHGDSQDFAGQGTCSDSSAGSATFQFALADDTRYVFRGSMQATTGGSAILQGDEVKAGVVIDHISLSLTGD